VRRSPHRLLIGLLVLVTVSAGCAAAPRRPTALAHLPQASRTTLLPGAKASQTPIPTPIPTVLVYGDSLTVESEAAARFLYPTERFVFRAEGGAGMCDYAPGAAADREKSHPARVVLAFTGNVSNCSLAAFKSSLLIGVVDNYETALRTFQRAFTGLPITVISPPAMNSASPTYPPWFPLNGNPAFGAMYQRVCASLGLTYSLAADRSLTPGHVFRMYGPRFAAGPAVPLRLVDGIHLTPEGSAWYGAAIGAA
jgi:hypothetical protein